MSANRLKNKPRDRARLKRRRLREQKNLREAGQELPADLLADLPPDLQAAMAALAHPGRLYATVACYKVLSEWAAECVARGGEYLAVLVRSSNATSCCGRDFLAVSTVQLCGDPTCRADYRATPEHVAVLRDVLRRYGPSRVRFSAGWPKPAGIDTAEL